MTVRGYNFVLVTLRNNCYPSAPSLPRFSVHWLHCLSRLLSTFVPCSLSHSTFWSALSLKLPGCFNRENPSHKQEKQAALLIPLRSFSNGTLVYRIYKSILNNPQILSSHTVLIRKDLHCIILGCVWLSFTYPSRILIDLIFKWPLQFPYDKRLFLLAQETWQLILFLIHLNFRIPFFLTKALRANTQKYCKRTVVDKQKPSWPMLFQVTRKLCKFKKHIICS